MMFTWQVCRTEALKKRRIDVAGKTPAKHVNAPGKKNTEPLKIIVPQAKTGMKRPSDVEVASAKPVKRTKNVAQSSSVAPAAA
jgi:hypothetical protein